MAVVGTATLNIVPKVQGGLANAINGEIKSANVPGIGKTTGKGFMNGFTSGASIGIWSNVAGRAIDAVTSKLGSAASRVDTLNNFPRIMQTLGVSANDATASMRVMSTSLDNVPTRLDDMANTVQGIYAATMRYGVSLGTVTDAGLALNSMLLAGGQSTAVVNAAMEQFRQMVAKGKPDMQDWRSLISAAPGQMNQLAQSMLDAGASAEDLYAALGGGKEGDYTGPYEWGSISMGEFVEKFAQMRSQFEGAAEEAQGGIATSFSNMQNAVTKGVANVLQAFGQERIASAISDVKGMINGVFGKDDTQGLRAFATDVAPMVSAAWDSMVAGAERLGGIAGPGISSVLSGLKDMAGEAGPAVGNFFSSVADSVEKLTPAAADTTVRVLDSAGKAVSGLADIASQALPVLTSAIEPVLPAIGNVAEALAPAIPYIVTGKVALDGLGKVGGALSGVGGVVQGVAGAFGAFADVLPMIGGLKDVGPALELVAESGKLMGASGIVSGLGRMATAAADVLPMVGGFGDLGAAFSLVAESGGAALAAINPIPVAIGAAALGVGAIGYSLYDSWKKEKDFTDGLVGIMNTARRTSNVLRPGARAVDDLGDSYAVAYPSVQNLTDAIGAYAESTGKVRSSASEQIGALGRYKTVIDEAARATADGIDLSEQEMGRLQAALDGLNALAGTDYQISDIVDPAEPDKIRETVGAIDELIAKMQQQARTDALKGSLTEAYKLQEAAATELARAEANYYESHDQWIKDYIASGGDAALAEEQFEANHQDLIATMGKAQSTYAVASQEVETYEQKLGSAASAAEHAEGSVAAWVDANTRARTSLGELCVDTDALSAAMEGAGVTSAQLDAMGEASFAQLAAQCNGSIEMMVAGIQAYNSQPVVDKEGNIHVEQASLIDAQGNVYTWNGTTLVDQNGVAAADDTRLLDAYGNVIRWNNTDAKVIFANISNTSNPVPSLIGWLDSLKARDGMSVHTTVTNTTHNLTINEIRTLSSPQHTSSGTMATGGHAIPRHAAGYIAAGPTRTNFGLVGEDGIEAVYNNADGSSDVYPLTNPRYLHYADPLGERIAGSILGALGDVGPKVTAYITATGGDGARMADEFVSRLNLILRARGH